MTDNKIKNIITMQKTVFSFFLLLALCFFGTIVEIKACSPVHTPFRELLNNYNSKLYMAVEGYYSSATKFMVTSSTHSLIKVEQEYDVFEFGPFGNNCESYELPSNKPDLVGERKQRLLIVYKDRSVNGKLVTPIFWKGGVDVSKNKIVSEEYKSDYGSTKYFSYECLTPFNEIWQLLLEENTKNLVWIEKNELRQLTTTIYQEPQFFGGNVAFQKFISDEIYKHIPKRQLPTKGSTTILFTVRKNGIVEQVKVIQEFLHMNGKEERISELDTIHDNKIVKIIETTTEQGWLPGRLNGFSIDVTLVLYIAWQKDTIITFLHKPCESRYEERK